MISLSEVLLKLKIANRAHVYVVVFCPLSLNQITETDEKTLKILTYVGLALSITGIILTVIIYVYFT